MKYYVLDFLPSQQSSHVEGNLPDAKSGLLGCSLSESGLPVIQWNHQSIKSLWSDTLIHFTTAPKTLQYGQKKATQWQTCQPNN